MMKTLTVTQSEELLNKLGVDCKYPKFISLRELCTAMGTLLEKVEALESKVGEVKSKPVNIPWEVISKGWKYFAQDEDGGMYLYKETPNLNNDLKVWSCLSDYTSADCFDIDTSGLSWEETLTKRPEERVLQDTEHSDNDISLFGGYKI